MNKAWLGEKIKQNKGKTGKRLEEIFWPSYNFDWSKKIWTGNEIAGQWNKEN